MSIDASGCRLYRSTYVAAAELLELRPGGHDVVPPQRQGVEPYTRGANR
jgi:hypothetical protein